MGSECSSCNTPMAYVPDSKEHYTKTVMTRDGQVRVYTNRSRKNSDAIDKSLMCRK